MKHTISLVLAVLLLSLCACGSKPPHPTAAPTAAPTEPAGTILVSEGQPVEQLDDLSVYIRVSGERVDLGDLPAFVYGKGTEYFSNATTDPWAGQEAAYKKNP